MSLWLLLPFAAIVSYFLTAALRRYALSASMIDVPNARSSHTVPTPRGGGVAIVLAFLFGLVTLGFVGVLPGALAVGLFGAGLIAALVGFLDDHGHVPARWRLLGHFSAAAWGLFWMAGAPPLVLFGTVFNLGWVGHVLGAVYLVWLLNLNNFMDGIDGLASGQAVTACIGGALLYWQGGQASQLWLCGLLLAAVAGFWIWNFPPAKIFMGDAGSGFLGIMMGLLALHAAWISPAFFWSWLILLGVFIVDATWTLFRRLLRGEKVHEAHRSHAYQYASRHYKSHRVVTLSVLLMNVIWLIPLALLVGSGLLNGAVGLLIAYVPLFVLAVKFKAGQREG
ncbi:TPA: glycosyltransferase family 4 protein [Pseudomonas putida]|uniref:MraY family glycosyltransferase n=1 Tax=Pseudomonas putida TaxID=303 RepID=UPI00110D146B|nr:glycosyltransferase family 4 protein [Pseudomonas putida]MDD1993787.1 glycosyltransferase family 4 protein [Pseudomonas putida]HDS0916918.1 glycosyltransferase family 4 protein [Pseudomonas putida]HDS0932559.1 glycosyltransferase family 4 protein [Pseudomonas putida]HDS1782121.1 glycosyltransferase family 4 protein [Pseudomonas putida]HDS3797931.1 glycosyltransferase family 4 protein [Pseudomonas putida]